jgi:predicted nuclease with TOPRIM domain
MPVKRKNHIAVEEFKKIITYNTDFFETLKDLVIELDDLKEKYGIEDLKDNLESYRKENQDLKLRLRLVTGKYEKLTEEHEKLLRRVSQINPLLLPKE